MKRLKNYLLDMDPNNSTYKEMYEGEMVIPAGANTEYHYDSTYWNECISYRFERTKKHELDKPTIIIQIPVEKLGVTDFSIASADYILRFFHTYIDELNAENYNRKRPDKENGMYYLYHPCAKVLARNTAYFKHINQRYYILKNKNVICTPENMAELPALYCICILLQVQLPHKKHRKTIQMLTKDLPDAVEKFITEFDLQGLNQAVELYQKQEIIRSWLKDSSYCAFIANGSILPREKGTDLPFSGAIPFHATENDEIEICGVKGMGIAKGVTVITGGGYSGKSTLLDAISDGIYPHISGDGRELVISDNSSLKISAEDGRSIKNVNISPFIKWIPNGDERIDIRMLHNIVSYPQLNAIAFIIRKLELEASGQLLDLNTAVDTILERIDKEGLDSVFSSFFTQVSRFMDMPRRYEILEVIYRMRNISFVTEASTHFVNNIL